MSTFLLFSGIIEYQDRYILTFPPSLTVHCRRAATLGTRRTVKQQWQAAWLLKAVTCIDLTTLSGDDTETNVARLCLKAARPVRKDLLEAMDMLDAGITTGAVCVYPNRVKECVELLKK